MVHPIPMRSKTSISRLQGSSVLRSKSDAPVLAYDLGGTKVAVGVVTPSGEILDERRVPVVFEQGKHGVLKQLAGLGKVYLKRYPGIETVGIASAGPLDAPAGTLLNPTNYSAGGKAWGKFPIARLLGSELNRKCVLENDAAAALLAEHWLGAALGVKNVMILTLGTGLGTAVLADGKLLRGGRGLHTEAGHIPLNIQDAKHVCGCGLPGCAEVYLSGHGFGVWAAERFTGSEKSVVVAAQKGGAIQMTKWARSSFKRDAQLRKIARQAFSDYSKMMAHALQSYVSIFSPELVVLTGGFADCADLFLPEVQKRLRKLLAPRCIGINFMPKIRVSTLDNRAGVLGAAYVALNTK
jgi:glucokinase